MKLRTMCALCVSSVFAVAAIAAQGASAQTAYECASTTAGAGFKDAHCKEAVATGAAFKHVAVPENAFKAVSLTNFTTGTERSTLKLKSVQASATLELQAVEVSGAFSLENKAEGAEMWSEGKGPMLLEKVTVTAPAGRGCTVKGSTGVVGKLPTNEIFLTTRGLTNEWELTEIPGSKTNVLFEFTVEGCSIAGLNKAYAVTGSVKGTATGTTIVYTHATGTTEATMLVGGQKAGFEGSLTPKFISTGFGIALT